ncbi:hypothetical protein M1F27_07845 [Trueperella pyogenes]|uniref:hypothetical protein n=1 Tax=Trueperella pyogenes TaxID=1661 RepID=UPI002168A599|nr:hypothetical protein [Trueperella pyogenes]UVJ56724.1 hypothetical protein M1F27_07845 [Trueperella pyogenes]
MFDHHATTDFASRITHPHIQTTSNQSFRHHTNEKYAQKQHKMANLEVESNRLKKHQTPPHQQKTRNQQHKMAYKPTFARTPGSCVRYGDTRGISFRIILAFRSPTHVGAPLRELKNKAD